MVFNIYNKSSYDSICDWNDNNKNFETNQIDQYLKKQNLKIIITYPFEFACTDTISTICDVNLYSMYENMFKNSLLLIKKKIDNCNNIIELD